MRTSSAGRRSSTPCSKRVERRRRSGPARRCPTASATSARVVVSSKLTDTVVALARRRFMSAATARAMHGVGLRAGDDLERVERVRVDDVDAAQLQPGREDRRERRDAARDAAQAFGAVVDRVHAGDDRRQHLRRADVGRRLLAADVLLARLQREAVGRRAVRVDADADQAARQRALERVLRGQVGGVRAAGAHGHAEALRVAAGDVGAELARRPAAASAPAGRRRRSRGRRARGSRRPAACSTRTWPVTPGYWNSAAKQSLSAACVGRADHAPRCRSARARVCTTSSVCGSTSSATKNTLLLLLPMRMRQRHRLGRGGGLVEHRRVGDGHAGEVGDHGLEVEQRFHAALRDLGLVGRVGGVPGRVLEDVAQDDARRDACRSSPGR